MSQIKFIPQRRCKSVVEAHLREHNLNQLRKGDKKLTASFVAIDDCNDSLNKKFSLILNRESEMTIPKFLTEMSEQMNAQNNRSTSNPIWQVRCKRMRITADNYSDFWQIVDDNNECRVVTSCLKEDVNKDILEYFKDIGELEFIHKYADWTEEFNTSAEKEEYFVDSFDHECGELPENLRVIWLEEYEEIIKSAFFTEMDALSFITRRQHKYPKLYTYVDSMCECPQIIQLQEWIKSLTPPTKQGDTK